MAEQNGATGSQHENTHVPAHDWQALVMTEAVKAAYGGVPVYLKPKANSKDAELDVLPLTESPSKIFAFTNAWRGAGNHPNVLNHVQDLTQETPVYYVDLFPNNVWTLSHPFGRAVYYDPKTQSLTLSSTNKNSVLCGFVIQVHARLQDENWNVSYNFKHESQTLLVGDENREFPSNNTLDMSRGHLSGSSAQLWYQGSERVIYHGVETGGDGTRMLTLDDGSGNTLTTLTEGSHVCYRCTRIDSETNKPVWSAFTNRPIWMGEVDLSLETLRAAFTNVTSTPAQPLQHKLIASTTGMKKAWALEDDAPASTSSDEGGYLTIGGAAKGDTVLITATDDEDNERESSLLPLTGSALTLSLLDNYVNVQSDSTTVANRTDYRVRVTHVATGHPNATFTVKVWLVSA